MARHRNVQWCLAEGTLKDGKELHSWESIQTALLMDIRDELQEINRTLGCFRVRRMCDDVNRIERRLTKHLPLKRKKP